MNILSKEKLLEFAGENYPIGTKFISPCEKSIQTANMFPYFFTENYNIAVKSHLGVIYYNGKWAEIISSPKPKEIFYEIY